MSIARLFVRALVWIVPFFYGPNTNQTFQEYNDPCRMHDYHHGSVCWFTTQPPHPIAPVGIYISGILDSFMVLPRYQNGQPEMDHLFLQSEIRASIKLIICSAGYAAQLTLVMEIQTSF
jgi:hypothetical protein